MSTSTKATNQQRQRAVSKRTLANVAVLAAMAAAGASQTLFRLREDGGGASGPRNPVSISTNASLPYAEAAAIDTAPLPAVLSAWYPTDEWLRSCVNDTQRRRDLIKPFPMAAPWGLGYRLGDCIKRCNPCNTDHSPPSCLAREYGRLACPPKVNPNYVLGGNLTAVLELFDEKRANGGLSFTVPQVDELVIHLRLGDIIEGSGATVDQMLISGANPNHFRSFKNSIKSVYEFLSDISSTNLTKVSIVGGSHRPQTYKKSRVYAHCLKRAIEEAGYTTKMQLNANDPDHDFYYMSNAKSIIVTTGGYSRLIGQLVKKQGGTIAGRRF